MLTIIPVNTTNPYPWMVQAKTDVKKLVWIPLPLQHACIATCTVDPKLCWGEDFKHDTEVPKS